MKRYERAMARVSELFDLPGDALAGLIKITVTGSRRLHVENHRGLLEYGGEEISVNGGSVVLRVLGAGLELVSMNDGELVITGDIRRMDLETV